VRQAARILEGKEAMKRQTLVWGLVLAAAAVGSGCKSAPQLAWWKKPAGVEATAVAHAAPQDPAEAAKLAEASRGAEASKAAGPGVAPAFSATAAAPPTGPTEAGKQQVATATPRAADPTTAAAVTSAAASLAGAYQSTPYPANPYPTTGAQVLTPETALSAVASANPQLAAQQTTANLGTFTAPYNPSAVPGGAEPAVAAAVRYGQAAETAASGAAAAVPPTIDRYAAAAAAAASPAGRYGLPPSPSPAGAPPSANPSPAAMAGLPAYPAPLGASRYGGMGGSATGVSAAMASPTTTAVAAAVPAGAYRPGGTTTYPGAQVAANGQSAEKIATRPEPANPYAYRAENGPGAASPTGYQAAPVEPTPSVNPTFRY